MKVGWNVTPWAIYGHGGQNLKTPDQGIGPDILNP
jgi:hypothetical protein